VLFAWWFLSGIFMMYVDFPEVKDSDRLARAQEIDASRVRLTGAAAWARVNTPGEPDDARLLMYDGRPAYSFRLGRERAVVYADSGEAQRTFSAAQNLRLAAAWSGQPASSARVERMAGVDQWTVGGIYREHAPLMKYSFADGQQVYIAAATGEVVQSTTTRSRVLAYLGPVAHWLYFTPLRKNGQLWSRLVIWLSGAATVVALLGLYAGLSLYSAAKRIPFTGTKRLHMILGLFFGFITCTWAFSGMLSMDPFPAESRLDSQFPALIAGAPISMKDFAAKSPGDAMRGMAVKELDLISVGGRAAYASMGDAGAKRVIPVLDGGSLATGYNARRIDRYDAYYLDRTKQLPLPVWLVELNDSVHSRFYVEASTLQIVGSYSSDQWSERWLYHGLHSINFPWLYNHRPAWDIVVLALMTGGAALSITSVIIGWSFISRKVYSVTGARNR